MLLYLCVLVCVLAIFRLLVKRGKAQNNRFRKEVDFHKRQGMVGRERDADH